MTSPAPAIPANADDVSAAWLSDALRASGALTSGEVAAFACRANPAFNSAVTHLELTYDPPGAGPPFVLLKIATSGLGVNEVAFYGASSAQVPAAPNLVRCFHAAADEVAGTSTLLLEDLSASHAPPVERARVLALMAVPADRICDQIAVAIGELHARWWEHPALESEPFARVRPWYRDETYFARHCERRRREWAQFDPNVGMTLDARERNHYVRSLEALPGLWARFLAGRVTGCRMLTLTHGDCYLGQFLSPRSPDRARSYVVDFGDVSGNFGAYDLIYAFCTFWTREQRADQGREMRLLRLYHETLVAGGVVNFPFEQLLLDYRLMLVFMIFDAIWNQTDGASESYWRPKMQCLISAFEDWDCAALLRD